MMFVSSAQAAESKSKAIGPRGTAQGYWCVDPQVGALISEVVVFSSIGLTQQVVMLRIQPVIQDIVTARGGES